ncbi:lipid A biosynthesis acyltransferase [Geothermobacter hydrogeniphilus]|uniref:Lipid A biosynthesis acyltransferase n=1 Tax=Geothermobacter hydrogeniphilus TaxID=1969733 RepID=A0A2K2HBJ2_9BACT|nr:lysophospholipid acyltransferase family protein [Geothermobacter hydrogeniphilus]PNU20631.1 lipid A biosynthesis acyltransferase [Geothermobacter hydrogeniphilus]
MAEQVSQPRNWSSRSIGAAWQHQFFYLLLRLGGRRAAYLFLYLVVGYYMVLRPDQRAKCAPYVRHRFPAAGAWMRFIHSYCMSLGLGRALLDRALVGILGPERLRIDVDQREELLGLVAEGRGLVLMTAHLGSWQAALARVDFLRRPVYMLMHREAGDIDRHYYEHQGEESPFRMIDPTGFLGGAVEMLTALKQGDIVSVMGDRMLGADRNSIAVEFLGGEVHFPYSAYKLASASGAPIAVLFNHKTGPDSYRIELVRVIRVPREKGRQGEEFRPYVAEFVRALEEYVQAHPYQFFNFFDLWNKEG